MQFSLHRMAGTSFYSSAISWQIKKAITFFAITDTEHYKKQYVKYVSCLLFALWKNDVFFSNGIILLLGMNRVKATL